MCDEIKEEGLGGFFQKELPSVDKKRISTVETV